MFSASPVEDDDDDEDKVEVAADEGIGASYLRGDDRMKHFAALVGATTITGRYSRSWLLLRTLKQCTSFLRG